MLLYTAFSSLVLDGPICDCWSRPMIYSSAVNFAGSYIYVSQQMKSCDRGLRLLHCFNCIIVKRGRWGYKVTAIKNLHEVQQTIGIHQTVQETNRSEQEAKRIVHETNRTVQEAYRTAQATNRTL